MIKRQKKTIEKLKLYLKKLEELEIEKSGTNSSHFQKCECADKSRNTMV